MYDYNDMLKYVHDYLEENNGLFSKRFSFRNRYLHIKRVYNWAKRLVVDFPNCNVEATLTSCIFHDVGYAHGKELHPLRSEKIFKHYCKDKNFPQEFIDLVSECILKHSDKSQIKDPNTKEELIILLEADLIDEEGAHGIAWDLMAYGALMPDSYDDAYNQINNHSGHILVQDYMITPMAKEIWAKKQRLVREFLQELKEDLFLETEE